MAVPLCWAVRGLTSVHSLKPSLHAGKRRRLADGLPQEGERGVGGIKRLTRLAEVCVKNTASRQMKSRSELEREVGVRVSSRLHAPLLSRPVMKKPPLSGLQGWRSERDEESRGGVAHENSHLFSHRGHELEICGSLLTFCFPVAHKRSSLETTTKKTHVVNAPRSKCHI